jgi:hypothetical protein
MSAIFFRPHKTRQENGREIEDFFLETINLKLQSLNWRVNLFGKKALFLIVHGITTEMEKKKTNTQAIIPHPFNFSNIIIITFSIWHFSKIF